MANVLIMDDDFELSLAMSRTLRREGFDVDLAKRSSEATNLLERHDYDCVVVDIIVRVNGIPVTDGGITLINWLRSPVYRNRRNSAVPILAISGAIKQVGMQHILVTAKSLGATATLDKPFLMEELVDSVRDLLPDA